jgi:hypothetical protein
MVIINILIQSINYTLTKKSMATLSFNLHIIILAFVIKTDLISQKHNILRVQRFAFKLLVLLNALYC